MTETVPATKPKLTEFEVQLVTFLGQHYQLHNVLLSQDKAFEDYGIPVEKYKRALANPLFKQALVERGIVFERFDTDNWTSKSLTPIQLLVADCLLDLTDTRTNKKKLQDHGVSTLQYNAWLKDPVFKDYLHKRASAAIGDNAHEVDLALLDRVRAGDLKAIELYYEMTGKFVKQRANASQIDPTNLITRIIEIIIEEVSDPDEAKSIAQRLRALITARNVAGALVQDEEPIIVPEITATRELKELD